MSLLAGAAAFGADVPSCVTQITIGTGLRASGCSAETGEATCNAGYIKVPRGDTCTTPLGDYKSCGTRSYELETCENWINGSCPPAGGLCFGGTWVSDFELNVARYPDPVLCDSED